MGSWVLGTFSRTFNEPWVLRGDVISLYVQLFGLQKNSSAQIIPGYGWPFLMDITSFLTTDWLSQGLYRSLLFYLEPFAAVHAYLILSFGLIALATYVAWRSFGFSMPVSAISALALSLAPWHLQRALVHPSYALYISVPLFLIFVSFYLRWQNHGKRTTYFGLLFILFLISISAEYYWVFTLLFLIIFIFYANIFKKIFNNKIIFQNFFLIIIIPLSGLISLMYQRQISIYPNLGNTVERNFAQVETYSGSFMSILLPSPLTAIPFLDRLRLNFESTSLYVNNENHPWSSIFIIFSILFVFALLAILAFSNKDSKLGTFFHKNTVENFQIKLFVLLFFVGLFFYWTTGFGSLFGFFISDWMRSWGRMYIFIAYFAVAAMMLALKHLGIFSKLNRNIKVAALISTLALIFTDQAINQVPAQADAKSNYVEAQSFSLALSDFIKPGCPILQIPVFPFPEAGYNLNDFADYDHFWLSLADNSRPYSYGANKAHQQFLWQKNLNQEDPQKLALQAAAIGYCAIVVDLSAFESRVDEGNRWIKALGAPLAVSESARWAAWPSAESYSSNQLRELIALNWFGEFAAGEVQEEIQIDFYDENFELYALNPTTENIVGEISFKAISGTCTPSQSVKIIDSTNGEVLLNSEVNKDPKLLTFEFELAPREQKRISFELSSKICTVEWWSDTKVAFREQEFRLTQS